MLYRRLYADLDTDPAASCVAGYNDQVDSYLGNPDTSIWNASYSGLFKLFFDVLEEGALAGKPVLLAATGGTARHSLAIDQAMLPMFWMLKARPVPTPVFGATEDWGTASGLKPGTTSPIFFSAESAAGWAMIAPSWVIINA